MLATVSALGYRNGVDNPLAHFGKGGPSDKLGLFTADAILNMDPQKNPVIADPLKLHDCSLVTDGSAALVIMKTDEARKLGKKAVEISGIGHVNERIAISVRPNMHELMAGKEAVRRAFAEAKIGIGDVDIAEVHDCFTINQLLTTEALGLSRRRAGRLRLPGRPLHPRRRGLRREPLRRPEGQGPSRGRHRRLHARPPLQAAGGRGHRRHPREEDAGRWACPSTWAAPP